MSRIGDVLWTYAHSSSSFVHKLARAGFRDVRIADDRTMTVDDCERYPLFTPALIATMRRLLPPQRRAAVARAVVLTARRP